MPEGNRFFTQLRCRPVGLAGAFTAGFTLVELLVVIAIGAILAAIAVPSLRNLVAANQLAAATDTLAAALYEARSEAGKLGVPVALAATGGNWNLGWTSFVDTDGDGILQTGQGSPPEVLLRTGGALPASLTMNSKGAAAAAFANVFWFDPSGRLLTKGPPAATAEFLFCQGGGPANGGAARMITISASGRVRTAKNNSSGVPLDDGGIQVPCS
ncbi:MAG: GspH/FimT family pseudopilin [Burkholderiaceae bacterium]|nr:GspH/FimT family pseudopilin [Burkholderiaceae bacterium]